MVPAGRMAEVLAALRADLRQGSSADKAGGQERADLCAQHAFVQEAVGREAFELLLHQILRGFQCQKLHVLRVTRAVAVGVFQLQHHLRMQGVQGGVQRVGHVEVFALLTQVGRAQPHRKERALELLHHMRQRIARRKFAPAGLLGSLLRIAPFAAHAVQRLHDLFNVKNGHGLVLVATRQSCTQGRP